MKTERIEDIRRLLDRYYAGLTEREDELRLIRFFADAGELPPDLEADRQLFSGLSEIDLSDVDMPEEYSERITAAVEAEMKSGERRQSRSAWRGWMYALSGVACVALVLAVAVGVLFDDTEKGVDARGSLASQQGSLKPDVKDSVINIYDAGRSGGNVLAAADPRPAGTERVIPAARVAPRADVSRGRTDSNVMVAAGINNEDDRPEAMDSDDVLDRYEREEQKMLADNYYVVDDEHEADAIVSSIFARLESNMAFENSRISDIGESYEMEMNKISQ